MDTLDDAVWDTPLLAKMGQVDNQLNRINIMRNDNEFRLLVLNQSNTMVQSLLDEHGFLADFTLLLSILRDRLGFLDKTSLLLLCRLGTVFVQQFEEGGGGVFVEDVGELGDGGRDLKTFLEDLLLTL